MFQKLCATVKTLFFTLVVIGQVYWKAIAGMLSTSCPFKQLFWCHYLVVIGALKAGSYSQSFHHIYHQLHHMPLFMGGSHSTCRSTTQQLHQNLPMVAQVDVVYLLWCCSIRSITKPNSKRITTAFSSSYSIKNWNKWIATGSWWRHNSDDHDAV